MSPYRIGTHDGKFHVDDGCAVAAALMLYPDAEVVRTRDEEKLAHCNLRLDTGRKYNPDTNDFDHHQGGIEPRENGIIYSSFGLFWKKYGVSICAGDPELAEKIDRRIVQGVDAFDNGQQLNLNNPEFPNVYAYQFGQIVTSFNPEGMRRSRQMRPLRKRHSW